MHTTNQVRVSSAILFLKKYRDKWNTSFHCKKTNKATGNQECGMWNQGIPTLKNVEFM